MYLIIKYLDNRPINLVEFKETHLYICGYSCLCCNSKPKLLITKNAASFRGCGKCTCNCPYLFAMNSLGSYYNGLHNKLFVVSRCHAHTRQTPTRVWCYYLFSMHFAERRGNVKFNLIATTEGQKEHESPKADAHTH